MRFFIRPGYRGLTQTVLRKSARSAGKRRFILFNQFDLYRIESLMTLLYLECDFVVFLDLVQVAFYVSENTFLRRGVLDKPKSFGFIEKRDDTGSIYINFLCRLPFRNPNFDMFSVDSFLFCDVRGIGGDIPVFFNIGQHAIPAAIGSMS